MNNKHRRVLLWQLYLNILKKFLFLKKFLKYKRWIEFFSLFFYVEKKIEFRLVTWNLPWQMIQFPPSEKKNVFCKFVFFLSLFFFIYIYICKLFESCWDVIKARIVTIFTHVEIPLCTRVMKGGELTWNRKEGFVWKLSYLIILFIKTFIRSNVSYLTL